MAKYGKFVGKDNIPVCEWNDGEINGFVSMLCSIAEGSGIPFKECVVTKHSFFNDEPTREYLQVSFTIDGEISGRNTFGDRIRNFSNASFVIINGKLNEDYRVDGMPDSQFSMYGVNCGCRVAKYRCKNFSPLEIRKHFFYGTEVRDFSSELEEYFNSLEDELDGLFGWCNSVIPISVSYEI